MECVAATAHLDAEDWFAAHRYRMRSDSPTTLGQSSKAQVGAVSCFAIPIPMLVRIIHEP